MKRFLRLLLLVPLAVAAIAMAEANRHSVAIYLDPLAGSGTGGTEIAVPLFVVVFASLVIGVILGSMATYFEQSKYRAAARKARAEADSLRAEVARLSLPRPGEKRKLS